MSNKKRTRVRRSAEHRWERFEATYGSFDSRGRGTGDLDDGADSAFDLKRWRDDLAERSRERDQLRRRDERKGLFSGVRVQRPAIDPELLGEV